MMVLDILIALGVGVLCSLCWGVGYKVGVAHGKRLSK